MAAWGKANWGRAGVFSDLSDFPRPGFIGGRGRCLGAESAEVLARFDATIESVFRRCGCACSYPGPCTHEAMLKNRYSSRRSCGVKFDLQLFGQRALSLTTPSGSVL